MQYRTLGRTQLRVSEVGYGGGRIQPNEDESEVLRVFHRAQELGFNLIDTAPTYGGGRSETLIGRALRDRRDQWIIATKTEAFDPEGIRMDIEGSLRRLQTDRVDILQFHGGWHSMEDATKILENGGLETYQRLREEGKIRFLGFSADGPSAGTERLIACGEFDVIQTHYNLMYQSTCDLFGRRGILFDAEAQEMGIMLMRSTTSGVFPRLMRQAFPDLSTQIDWDECLLNYVLSNPWVDAALMSLRNPEDAEWTNRVSDETANRLNLEQLHRR